MVASVVDGGALLQVIWVSLVAGVGLSLVFSLAIAGGARAGQQRRAGNVGAGMAWTVVTVACTLACAVAVVLAVAVMLDK